MRTINKIGANAIRQFIRTHGRFNAESYTEETLNFYIALTQRTLEHTGTASLTLSNARTGTERDITFTVPPEGIDNESN